MTQLTHQNNIEGTLGSTAAAFSQSTSSNYVNQVIVDGSGDSLVNGTYTKEVGQMYRGAPVYSKGRECVIYRDLRSMGNNNWFISVRYGNVIVIDVGGNNERYGSPNNADSMTPPTNGWVTIHGASPAPKVRFTLKKCGKCGKLKKKHSYRAAEWDEREDYRRTCQVCRGRRGC